MLPEYRALKERHSFVELVRTPDLAAEVTLQPIRRFGFDAAIIFSDILVIPEALGQAYGFSDEGGVRMAFTVRSRTDLQRLDPGRIRERLDYVAQALRLVRRELHGRTALIGFSGSPWTLANFMIQGASGQGFHHALNLLASDPATYQELASLLTASVIEYLHLQCDAGAEVVQIFDPLASLLPAPQFDAASGRWIRDIVAAIAPRVPVILFAKGAPIPAPDLARCGAQVLGFDSSVNLGETARRLPAHVAVQGNLAPEVLTTSPDQVALETRRILDSMNGRAGHIFNLGHGVPPGAPLENIEALVHTVRHSS